MRPTLSTLLISLLVVSFSAGAACDSPEPETAVTAEESSEPSETPNRSLGQPSDSEAVAIFAGGCFWCTESDFEHVDGVISAVSGYTGGTSDNPTYEQVSNHQSDHLEAVRITYDPSRITYTNLVSMFFRSIDPTQANGQFCDRGAQYRTAIFVASAEERGVAEAAKREAGEVLGQPVVTEIHDASRFWDAEDYHQDFYRTTPGRYNSYRRGCGRDARVEELWGDQAIGH